MIKAIFNALFPKAAELSELARELVAKELECTKLECENREFLDKACELCAENGKLKEMCDAKQYYINQLKFKIVCIEEPEKEEDLGLFKFKEQTTAEYKKSMLDKQIDDYIVKKEIDEIINEQNGDK